MRRISEFKGYRTTLEYAPETGAFVTRKFPEGFKEQPQKIEAEIIPLPQAKPDPQKARMAG